MKIKFKLFLIILFLLILLTLSSKINSQTFAGYGFKTGLVSAYHTESDENTGGNYTTDNRFGFMAGIFAEFFKIRQFNVIAEINFEQKGGNDKVYYTNVENHYSTLNLLSVPVLAKFTFPIKKFIPYISFGPRADILINSVDGLHDEFYKYVNPVNFGISLAAGTEVNISKNNSLIVEAAYSPDLTTYIFRPTGVIHNYSIRNYAFEFRTGLKFNH